VSPRHGAKVGGAAVDDGVVLFEQNSQHKDLVSPTHGSIKRARLVQLISMESTHAVVVPACVVVVETEVVVVVGPSVTVVVVARNSRHVAQQLSSPVSVPHAPVLARALQLRVENTSTQTSVVPVVVGGTVVLFAQYSQHCSRSSATTSNAGLHRLSPNDISRLVQFKSMLSPLQGGMVTVVGPGVVVATVT